jgi:hypothetical protein
LEAYEAWIVSIAKDDPYLPYKLKIIQRWKGHPLADKTWDIVCQTLSTDDLPSARDFITFFLDRAIVAREINRLVKEERQEVIRVNQLAERKWKSGEHQLAATMKSAVAAHEQASTRLLGREKKTGARKRFMRGWSDKFKELCGQPLDEVVRVFTEVVFNIRVTTDAVRGAQRPSTRAGRHKSDRDTQGQK